MEISSQQTPGDSAWQSIGESSAEGLCNLNNVGIMNNLILIISYIDFGNPLVLLL